MVKCYPKFYVELHRITQCKGLKKRCLNGENDARVNLSYLAFAILLSLYF